MMESDLELDLEAVYRRLGRMEMKLDKCIRGISWCQLFFLVIILALLGP